MCVVPPMKENVGTNPAGEHVFFKFSQVCRIVDEINTLKKHGECTQIWVSTNSNI